MLAALDTSIEDWIRCRGTVQLPQTRIITVGSGADGNLNAERKWTYDVTDSLARTFLRFKHD